MALTLTLTGRFEVDAPAVEAVKGRRIAQWLKGGVAQPLFAGAFVAGADRHGLPVLQEGETPAGCAPLTVAAGYGDTIVLA